jgi:uncharacterized membrane protein
MPNLLPLLLPWLVLLALLALPSNRHARAWWIWAPLAVFALLGAGLANTFDAQNNDGVSNVIQAGLAAAFGLAAIWLVGAGLVQRRRATAILLTTLAFAVVGVLTFVVGPAGEQVWDLSRWEPLALFLYLPMFWLTGGLVYAGALNLVGCTCRKRLDRVRLSVWLPCFLWVLWLVAGSALGGAVTLMSGGGFNWFAFVIGSSAIALLSFAVVLPFLVLSFACPFYRERLKSLLRLTPPEAAPAAASPQPLAERQVASP